MGSWGVRGWFRPRRTRGVRGAEPPQFTSARRTRGVCGLAPGLGINSFCDRFSHVFCGFSCISQPIYPTQNPLFPQQVPLACWWLSGVFPDILLILEHKIGRFVVISMVFSCKSRCVRIVYIYQKFFQSSPSENSTFLHQTKHDTNGKPVM